MHFESKILQLVYLYREEDANVKILKKNFQKNSIFLDNIPDNLEDLVISEKSILVIDDFEDVLSNDREKAKLIVKFSNYLVHHRRLIIFLIFQSYQLFYAKHRLNSILYQATSLILFRSINNFSMLKRFLNAYDIKLKSGEKLYDIFQKYVASKYMYLIVNIHPHIDKPTVYSQILYSDCRPFILFT